MWQEVDELWPICHSWQHVAETTLSAMSTLLAVAALLLLAALVVVVVRSVLTDGYGHRPPPASHPGDLVDRDGRWGAAAH